MLFTFNCIIISQNLFQISRKAHKKCVVLKIVKIVILFVYVVPWKHPSKKQEVSQLTSLSFAIIQIGKNYANLFHATHSTKRVWID
jgi:uncharacterized membrane protein affecting hemolysin expression